MSRSINMEQVSIKTKILVLLTVPFNMYRILTLYIVKVMKLKIRTQCTVDIFTFWIQVKMYIQISQQKTPQKTEEKNK